MNGATLTKPLRRLGMQQRISLQKLIPPLSLPPTTQAYTKASEGAKIETHASSDKPHIVVLGTGWGGFNFVKDVDREKYKVTVISPSNHFLFTPLLPSSAVGTLEFRAIEEPIRTIPNVNYLQAKARELDLEKKELMYEDIFINNFHRTKYDYLVLAVGAKTSTFNTPGVAEREGKEVFFLKHLYHARQIRNRILECFELAAIYELNGNIEERNRLLSFVVVGGGPTSCEFVGELHDFITDDVSRWFPDLRQHIKVTLIEAGPKLLGSFDASLASYVSKRFATRDITVELGVSVKAFENGKSALLSDGRKIDTGMMVWSAGLEQVKFVSTNLPKLPKGPTQRIFIDGHLRPLPLSESGEVYALGDCAVNQDAPLPPLAQAARVQGKWLAKRFNQAENPHDPQSIMKDQSPFKFFNLGSMASVGGWKGVLDFSQVGDQSHPIKLGQYTGFLSFLVWRFAYWGRQMSIQNKILIPMYWFKAWVFGRDISRF